MSMYDDFDNEKNNPQTVKVKILDYDGLRKAIDVDSGYFEVEFSKWFSKCTGKDIRKIKIDDFHYLLERKDGNYFQYKEYGGLPSSMFKVSLLHKEESELATKISELEELIDQTMKKMKIVKTLSTKLALKKMEDK